MARAKPHQPSEKEISKIETPATSDVAESHSTDSGSETKKPIPPERVESESAAEAPHAPPSFADHLRRIETPEIVAGIDEALGNLCEAIEALRLRSPSTVCVDALGQLGKLRGQFGYQYPAPSDS